jgi:IPT/TIG domain-containing protein
MKNTGRIRLILPLLALGLAGCDDGHSLSAPSAPSSISPPAISQPSPQPVELQPTVTSITPNTGTTRGGADGIVTGTQFQSGASVILGNEVATAYFRNASTIYFEANANAAAAGRVDVTVTNPNGLSSNLAGAYTFAPPENLRLQRRLAGLSG